MEDFLILRLCWPGIGPAGVTDDDALAVEMLLPLGANTVGVSDVNRIAVGVGLREEGAMAGAPSACPGTGTQLLGTQILSAPCSSAQARGLTPVDRC